MTLATVIPPGLPSSVTVDAEGVLEANGFRGRLIESLFTVDTAGPTNVFAGQIQCRTADAATAVELSDDYPEGSIVDVVDVDRNANANNITITAESGINVGSGSSLVVSTDGGSVRLCLSRKAAGALVWAPTPE